MSNVNNVFFYAAHVCWGILELLLFTEHFICSVFVFGIKALTFSSKITLNILIKSGFEIGWLSEMFPNIYITFLTT